MASPGAGFPPPGPVPGGERVFGSGRLAGPLLQARLLPVPLLPVGAGLVCVHAADALGQLELCLTTQSKT